MGRTGSAQFKGINNEQRTLILHTRLSESEMQLLFDICQYRSEYGSNRKGRTDVIVDALQKLSDDPIFKVWLFNKNTINKQ